MGAGSSARPTNANPVHETVNALKVLQEHLHTLTPYDQSRVKNIVPPVGGHGVPLGHGVPPRPAAQADETAT